MRSSILVQAKQGEDSTIVAESDDQILLAASDELVKAKEDLNGLQQTLEEIAGLRANIEKQAADANHTIEETKLKLTE